jgi:hypothetical protein
MGYASLFRNTLLLSTLAATDFYGMQRPASSVSIDIGRSSAASNVQVYVSADCPYGTLILVDEFEPASAMLAAQNPKPSPERDSPRDFSLYAILCAAPVVPRPSEKRYEPKR